MYGPFSRRQVCLGVAGLLSLSGCAGTPPEQDNTGSSPTATRTSSPPADTETPTTRPSSTSKPSSPSTPNQPSPSKPPSGLDSTLAGLVDADDRDAYADQHGLDYRDGAVAVVVELEPDRTLPESVDFEAERKHDRLVSGRVAVDDLTSLATHENVTLVRPPQAPAADGGAE
ncbi:hypothetical protein [Haloferax larsenii]|uniref:Uncharacterized protein n=1 Tax=Haloferax larsenii TaxID=302484 RepID=A0A1H7L1R7_HALLR|nr:hypothetical protein [Haloferax larsenii]SEK92971.1 hypothetical protein SAMN04488691_102184 [Haloferax larsenii]